MKHIASRILTTVTGCVFTGLQGYTPAIGFAQPNAPVNHTPLAHGSLEELSAEEESLLQEITNEATSQFQPSLSIYGFGDASATWNDRDGNTSFILGHLNLYLDGTLSPRWRFLAEVRFLYGPQGSQSPDANFLDPSIPQRIRTTFDDPTDIGLTGTWGGIQIERSYIEYRYANWASVRLGRFLSPYGIWNVDHGSLLVPSPRQPYIVGRELIPERQTGIELYGILPIRTFTLGYHLTISNGRGPAEGVLDLDNNKAIGGRLFFRTVVDQSRLQIGLSGYAGRYTETRNYLEFTPAPSVENFAFEAFEEVSLAADVQWLWRGIRLQSEAAYNDIVYDEDARGFESGSARSSDRRQKSLYVLAGYELPWVPVMPYFLYQYFDYGTIRDPIPRSFNSYHSGLWIRVRPNISIQLIGAYIRASLGLAEPLHVYEWNGQVAVAF